MSIPIERPPASLDAEAQEYLQRVLIQISASYEELEMKCQELEQRIKVLESKP